MQSSCLYIKASLYYYACGIIEKRITDIDIAAAKLAGEVATRLSIQTKEYRVLVRADVSFVWRIDQLAEPIHPPLIFVVLISNTCEIVNHFNQDPSTEICVNLELIEVKYNIWNISL